MNAQEELKPCPFCMCEDIKTDIMGEPYCTNCGAFAGMGWNTRLIEGALELRVAELTEVLEQINVWCWTDDGAHALPTWAKAMQKALGKDTAA